jgi:hypothetical protein
MLRERQKTRGADHISSLRQLLFSIARYAVRMSAVYNSLAATAPEIADST